MQQRFSPCIGWAVEDDESCGWALGMRCTSQEFMMISFSLHICKWHHHELLTLAAGEVIWAWILPVSSCSTAPKLNCHCQHCDSSLCGREKCNIIKKRHNFFWSSQCWNVLLLLWTGILNLYCYCQGGRTWLTLKYLRSSLIYFHISTNKLSYLVTYQKILKLCQWHTSRDNFHHAFSALFALQMTIAVVKDWERG